MGYLRACCDSENYYEAEDATVRVTAGTDDGFTSFCVQTSDDSSSQQEEVSIDCGTDAVIESFFFACYGNPSGSCSGDTFYYHGANCNLHVTSSHTLSCRYTTKNRSLLSLLQVAALRTHFLLLMTALASRRAQYKPPCLGRRCPTTTALQPLARALKLCTGSFRVCARSPPSKRRVLLRRPSS